MKFLRCFTKMKTNEESFGKEDSWTGISFKEKQVVVSTKHLFLVSKKRFKRLRIDLSMKKGQRITSINNYERSYKINTLKSSHKTYDLTLYKLWTLCEEVFSISINNYLMIIITAIIIIIIFIFIIDKDWYVRSRTRSRWCREFTF